MLGVRVSSTGKLVAFITGVPATVRYWGAPLIMSAQSHQPFWALRPLHLFLMHTQQASCCSVSQSTQHDHFAPQACADMPVEMYS